MRPAGELPRDPDYLTMEIRVRGRVQGVGFRPTVWRMARELDLCGEVLNDAEGVLVRVGGDAAAVQRLTRPHRARAAAAGAHRRDRGPTPIAAACRPSSASPRARRRGAYPGRAGRRDLRGLRGEIADPFERRFRYPFANCTHCGPRLSIVTGIPYDRANDDHGALRDVRAPARRNIGDPADRRFHAEAIACHACGPRARLIRFDGRAGRASTSTRRSTTSMRPAPCLQQGRDRRRQGARRISARLRRDQRRGGRAAAPLEAPRDQAVRADGARPRRHPPLLRVDSDEERLLGGAAAPIVLLRADGPQRLPEAVAPGLATLGFMLPTTPLHALLLQATGSAGGDDQRQSRRRAAGDRR